MQKIKALTITTLAVTGSLLMLGGQSASAKTPDCTDRAQIHATGQTWGLGNIRPGTLTLTTTGSACRVRVTTWSILGPWDGQKVKGNASITGQLMIHRDVVTVTKKGVTVRLKAPSCGPWQADVGIKGTVFFGGTNFGTPCQEPTPKPTTPAPNETPTPPSPGPAETTTPTPRPDPVQVGAPQTPAATVLAARFEATPVAVTRPELAATGTDGKALFGCGIILIGFGWAMVKTVRPKRTQPVTTLD